MENRGTGYFLSLQGALFGSWFSFYLLALQANWVRCIPPVRCLRANSRCSSPSEGWVQVTEHVVVKYDSVKLRLTVVEAEDLLQADYKPY